MWRRGRARQETHATGAPQKSVGSAGSRSQKNRNTFLYLKPTRLSLPHQTPNAAQLPDVPGEGTGCQDLPRPSNPTLDRKVLTHLAGAPFPGTAGDHPDRRPEPSRRGTADQPERSWPTVPGRPTARSHSRRALPCRARSYARSPTAARSSTARSLLRAAPPCRAPTSQGSAPETHKARARRI